MLVSIFICALFPTMPIQFRDAITLRLKGSLQDINIPHWTSQTALELIGQSGLFCVFLSTSQADHIHIYFQYRSWYISRHLPVHLLTCDVGYSFDNLNNSPANEYSIVVKNLLFVSSFSIYPIAVSTHLKPSRLIGRS